MNIPPLDPPATAKECRELAEDDFDSSDIYHGKKLRRRFLLRAHALAEMAERLEITEIVNEGKKP